MWWVDWAALVLFRVGEPIWRLSGWRAYMEWSLSSWRAYIESLEWESLYICRQQPARPTLLPMVSNGMERTQILQETNNQPNTIATHWRDLTINSWSRFRYLLSWIAKLAITESIMAGEEFQQNCRDDIPNTKQFSDQGIVFCWVNIILHIAQ